MKGFLQVINIILGTLNSICAVLLAVFGAKSLVLAANSLNNPPLRMGLTKLFMIMVAIMVLKVAFGMFKSISDNYVEQSTVVPICICFGVAMTGFIGFLHPVVGIICAIGYVTISGMIPVSNAMNMESYKLEYLEIYSRFTEFLREISFGMYDIIQFKSGHKTLAMVENFNQDVSDKREDIIDLEKSKGMMLNVAKSAFCLIIVFVMIFIYSMGKISFEKMMMVIAAGVFSIKECAKR